MSSVNDQLKDSGHGSIIIHQRPRNGAAHKAAAIDLSDYKRNSGKPKNSKEPSKPGVTKPIQGRSPKLVAENHQARRLESENFNRAIDSII